MKGYLGNGTTAPQAYVVVAGEAVTSGGNVTAVTAYAYNGRYDSGYTATLSNAGVSKNCNIGAAHSLYRAEYVVECTTTDLGYPVGDVVKLLSNANANYAAIPIYMTRNTVGIPVIGNHFTANKTTGGLTVALTVGSWKYKLLADRGW
jgi:hypothetical protein